MRRLVGAGLGLGLLAGAGAWAAPATPEGARKLQDTLELYVGRPAPGRAGVATVMPQGEGYAVTFDFAPVLNRLSPAGFSLRMSPVHVLVTPQADGTWHVTQAEDLALDWTQPGSSSTLALKGGTGTLVYDPALPGLRSSDTTIASVAGRTEARASDGTLVTSERETRGMRARLTGTGAGPGAVDLRSITTADAGSMSFKVVPAPPNGGAPAAGTPPFDVALRYAGSDGAMDLKGLRGSALADLWAWFVAHPSRAAVTAAQDEMKGRVRAALPLWQGIASTATVRDVRLDTPFGPAGIKTVSAELAIPGATVNAQVHERLAFDGLAIPLDRLPAWSRPLVPAHLAIDLTAGGFDLAEGAAAALEALDLAHPDAATPDRARRIIGALLPGGRWSLRLAPGEVTGSGYDLRYEGAFDFSGPAATGTATMRAKGLDALIRSVAADGGGDPNASKLVGVLALARGYAKPDGDGLVWQIAVVDNRVTVNGLPVAASPK